MTVLPLPDSRLDVCTVRVCGTSGLRAWLAGRWAILFSHPGDFAQEEMESDRWTIVLSRSFEALGVAPLALARTGCRPEVGWLGSLAVRAGESAAVLALESPPTGGLREMSAIALRADIARSGSRFAMIIDPNGRCRRTLAYRLPAELPSPLDLIGWAAALRKRIGPTGSPHGMAPPWDGVRADRPRDASQPP